MVVTCGVVSKNRRSGKAEHLGFRKEPNNIFMGFAKLGTVALVKDKNNALIFEIFHDRFMRRFADSGIEFLDGGDDELAMACHLVDELAGTICSVYTVGAKEIKFSASLVVKVCPIDDEKNFVDFWEFDEDLGGFEAGEGFA